MASRSALPLAALVCLSSTLGFGAQASPRDDAVRALSRRVEGRVLDADGWPLPGARVYVLPGPGAATPGDARRPLLETASDRDGHFVLEDLRPGTYRVDIEAPDHQAAHVGVHLPEGGGTPTPIEVHLWPVTTAARPVTGRTGATASRSAPRPASSGSEPEPSGAEPPASPTPTHPAASRLSPSSGSAAQPSGAEPEAASARSTSPVPAAEPAVRSSDRAVDHAAVVGDDDPAVDDGIADAVSRALAASQIPRAVSLLEGLPDKRAADAELFFQVGDALLRSGETAEAVRVLGEALDRDPDHLGARYARALARLGTGQLDGAREDFERVLQLQPDGPFADKARAALEELGSPAQ